MTRPGQPSNTSTAPIAAADQPASQPECPISHPSGTRRPGRPDSIGDLITQIDHGLQEIRRNILYIRRYVVMIIIAGLLIMWILGFLAGRLSATPKAIRVHPRSSVVTLTVSPSRISAQDIARSLHYPGDWRDLRVEIDHLNPGLDWGRLHTGDRILVPDTSNPTIPVGQVHPPAALIPVRSTP